VFLGCVEQVVQYKLVAPSQGSPETAEGDFVLLHDLSG
jgi:hypothetical protein